MNITITINDAVAQRVITALCAQNGYQATYTNPDGTTTVNPTPPNAFARSIVMAYIKDNVSAYESQLASDQASVTAALKVRDEIILS